MSGTAPRRGFWRSTRQPSHNETRSARAAGSSTLHKTGHADEAGAQAGARQSAVGERLLRFPKDFSKTRAKQHRVNCLLTWL
jgi:hypothetical protein